MAFAAKQISISIRKVRGGGFTNGYRKYVFDTIPQIALDLVTKIGRQEIQKHATARRPHQKYTKYHLQRIVQKYTIWDGGSTAPVLKSYLLDWTGLIYLGLQLQTCRC